MSFTSYQHQIGSIRANKRPDRKRPNHGFSLVEMLVASTILIIAFVALLTLIRTGRAIDIENLHRRAARSIIDSVFESQALNYTNYNNLISNHENGKEISLDNSSQSIKGSLSISVGNEVDTVIIVNGLSTTVSYKQVSTRVTWTEAGKSANSSHIEVTKRISSF